MEVRSPELLDAIMRLDNCQTIHRENYEKLKAQMEENRYVNLENGDGKRMLIANVIPKIYNDLQSIKGATEFLVDFSKLHKIFKKYYVYWIVTVTFTGWQIGSPIFTIIRDLVKHL